VGQIHEVVDDVEKNHPVVHVHADANKQSEQAYASVAAEMITNTTTKKQQRQDEHSNNVNKNKNKSNSSVEIDSNDAITTNDRRCSTSCCSPQRLCGRHTPYQIGHCTVLIPTLYERTGYGMVGPHWIGLLFTIALLWSLTIMCIRTSLDRIGIGTAVTCGLFAVLCTMLLLLVSTRDPGIVTKARYLHRNNNGKTSTRNSTSTSIRYEGLPTMEEDMDVTITEDNDCDEQDDRSHWKWCDMCKVYQPPSGAHCMICNVCVEGYDHHCPWMGCCVGQHNIKAFAFFNLAWVGYALYAIIWIAALSHKF